MSDFKDVDRLISQTQADLRRADNLCHQVDSMLSYDRKTIMNSGWMDTKYPLPKDTSSGQFMDVAQGRLVSTGGYGSQAGMDFWTTIGLISIPISMILGAIIGASVGDEYPYFYGFIGAFVGPFIALVLFVIGMVIYLILSFIFDW